MKRVCQAVAELVEVSAPARSRRTAYNMRETFTLGVK